MLSFWAGIHSKRPADLFKSPATGNGHREGNENEGYQTCNMKDFLYDNMLWCVNVIVFNNIWVTLWHHKVSRLNYFITCIKFLCLSLQTVLARERFFSVRISKNWLLLMMYGSNICVRTTYVVVSENHYILLLQCKILYLCSWQKQKKKRTAWYILSKVINEVANPEWIKHCTYDTYRQVPDLQTLNRLSKPF